MAYNTENTFVALIDQNGYIRDMSVSRRGDIVGIDYEKEEEYKSTIADMQEPLDSYYNKLVEIRKYLIDKYNDVDMVSQLSAFAPPITPEMIAQEAAAEQLRIAQEQSAQQAALLNAIESLSAEVKELKENGNTRNANEFSREKIRDDSKSNGTVRKTGKSGSAAGEENAS